MRFWGAALALALATPLAAPQVLNLRDADIRAFIQDASKVTGRTFVIDQRVTGKVSVVTDRPLSRSEYFEVFLSTLRANGLIAIPIGGGSYRIQPAEGAATQPGRVGSRGAASNAFVTEIFRLRGADATATVETVRPLISREGSVSANKAANSLVVADYADNIRRIRTLLNQLDASGADNTRVIPLRNAGAREIVQALQGLNAGSGGVAAVAIDSSNSVILRGDQTSLARTAAIVADLDRRAAAGSEIRVVFLQNADAEKLLPVLQQLVGQSVSITPQVVSTSPSSPQLPGTAVRPAAEAAVAQTTVTSSNSSGKSAVIARYEGVNAVIISASADVQRTLGEVIRQLDTRREQVLVEAIIVEISDSAARKLGVQLGVGGPGGGGFTTYSNVTPGILPIAAGLLSNKINGGTTTTTTVNGTTTTTTSGATGSGDLITNALSALNTATGGTVGGAIHLGGNTYLGAILTAVQQDNNSNLLSTPSIVTLDNQEAKILVGQEIPVTTGEALSNNFDNAFRTVQRQNVGIQLEVKPQINAGGAIKLYLRQEVSSIAGPVTSNSADLILNKREIQTTMTVDDGQIMAIGGLLDDNERRTLEKVPLLGDIPLIGELFRSRTRSRAKTNLMVFIRPTILRSQGDAAALAAQRYGYIRGAQMAADPNAEPSIDELLRDYMGIEPPVVAPPPSEIQQIAPTVTSMVIQPVELAPKKKR